MKRAKKSDGSDQRKFNVNVYLWHCKVGIFTKERDRVSRKYIELTKLL